MSPPWTEPAWIWPRAAYVHIPFCAHHCGYCDFAVAVGAEEHADRYLLALEADLSRLERPQPVQSLFIGGGTPSLLTCAQLERLFTALNRWLPLLPDAEVSLEANPDDMSEDKTRLLGELGVNRISLGAQSFRPEVLRVLERRHCMADVPRALERARRWIARLSLDLIFAVPGQNLDAWHSDVRAALALEPDHLATYGLTFEKGTRLWKQQAAGQVQALDEDMERSLYLAGRDLLQAAGFEHYEVSNFARPGQRCRHNQVYWANEAYFGFGMGAASYVRGVRRLNVRALAPYMDRALNGTAIHFQEERLTPEERARETVATQLRRADGIDRAAFLAQTGFSVDEIFGAKLDRLVDLGLVLDDGTTIQLTPAGFCVADAIVVEVL